MSRPESRVQLDDQEVSTLTSVEISVGLPIMSEIGSLGPASIATAARRAEELEFDAVGAPDVLTGGGTFELDSVTALATAAAVTERVHLEFGVLSLPTRPVSMLAAQIQTLQYLSGDRVRLGVGIGGFPGSPFWRAVGAPSKRRGHLADAALRVLPDLIAGKPTMLPDLANAPEAATHTQVTLAPGVAVPPIMVGGSTAEAALRRTAAYGDYWLPSALSPDDVAKARARLYELAAQYSRPAPRILLGLHGVLGTEPSHRSQRAAMFSELGEFFEMTPTEVADVTITGSPQQAAERIATYAEAGVDEIGFASDGDVFQQWDLLAEVKSLL